MSSKTAPQILALDMAITTGWAHSDGASGTMQLPEKQQGEHNGDRYIAMLEWLVEMCRQHHTRTIVYESGSHKRGGAAMRLGIGMATTLEIFCARRGLLLRTFNTSTIKKHATGNGHAKKPDMAVAAAARHSTIELIDDNHVDALFLLDLALNELSG
jgi:Holliday junction resolvasome RuvABC endonuclease subunit